MVYRSIEALQSALRSGATTCEAVVQQYLAQAEATRHLNAYVELWADEALAAARATDRQLRESPESLGPLFGVVMSLKDNICYASHRVTAGSKILEGYTALHTATAVERVLAAGAILIGRTNCDQFGMGSSNENSVYGLVRNALDETRVPGGSSGGAAVSVQTDSCLLAMGSDTGGSIRQPAAFCGLWGFKPTYGRISRHGLIAYGSSFDQIGFIGHCAADLQVAMAICAGADEYDATASERAFERTTEPTKSLRIAYFAPTLDGEGLNTGVKQCIRAYIGELEAKGHRVDAVPFDLLDAVIPAYYVLTTAEASANLARFDGIRYGYRAPSARNLAETYVMSRSEGFSDEVKRRILLGTFVLSSGYYDAYYAKAQQVRRLLRDRITAVLSEYDYILMPATPDVAWRFGEKSNDPTAMYLADIYTVMANLAGVPAIAIPIGTHPDNDMPIGVQWMGRHWADADLLSDAIATSGK
jgi:aspartyl-tRNA(Asn)/glutamyl-tRNA(Gln) amidotransferase subunit A